MYNQKINGKAERTVPVDVTSRTTVASQKRYLPLGINVAGIPCLVVGGGRVGARKAMTLAEYGARVTVLSPTISDRLQKSIKEGTVEWREGEYRRSQLEEFPLVVAATADPALNVRIAQDAEWRGALACVVSPGRVSRVIFPATHTQGNLTVAIHTNGRDCGRSREVRDEVAQMLLIRSGSPRRLVVLGVRRANVPADMFESLTTHAVEIAPRNTAGTDVLVLATCNRWECYFSTVSPRAVIHDIFEFVHRQCGILLEFHVSAVYTKYDVKAFHHLLRVASGLDSPLCGETNIIGQIRAAATRCLNGGTSPLRQPLIACFQAQKKVRRGNGAGLAQKNWSEAAVSLLEKRLSSLDTRRVMLIGCGKLGEAIARRLAARGVAVVPVSGRAQTSGVSWCAELGLAVQAPGSLKYLISNCDAAVLTSKLSATHAEPIVARGRTNGFPVIDFAGDLDRLTRGDGTGWYFRLTEIAEGRLSVQDAASVALAEKIALEQALRWHRDRTLKPPVKQTVRVGLRPSALSYAQAFETLDLLSIILPEISFETVAVEVPCDRDKTTPLPEVRQDDFFTHDLDEALRDGRIDLAVHSAKDLPVCVPEGLHIAALTPTFAPWECLVTCDGATLEVLPRGARVGTSSERRRQRLIELRPDLHLCDVRGNVPDRIEQLEEGRYDALVLAAAGLIRLGRTKQVSQVFSLEEFPPAPGQGSVALLVRNEDSQLRDCLEPIDCGNRDGLPWA